MIKPSINLLQPELLPEKKIVTLKNVVTVWVVALVMMSVLAGVTAMRKDTVVAQVDALSDKNEELENELSLLKEKLENHKPDAGLLLELDTLKSIIQNKRGLYKHLTNTDHTYIAGFGDAMGELSSLHSNDISLEHIVLNQDQYTFSGMARNPEAVPNWLANFERSTVLSGRLFEQFKLAESDNNLISFTVSSLGDNNEKEASE
ncbi:PilN domain-containing protein [Thalassotalea euphylliae]|uniref:PilN domain-containing protein n=1 Tax=Thalassotalea euphylliae TaxID=1655234 RepID=UPI003644D4D5